MSNLRLALRLFAQSPGFTAIIVLTLAIGIGANTAIFNLVSATCLRPLPYPEADRLIAVTERTASGGDMSVSYPNFVDWRATQDVASGLAIFRSDGAKLVTRDGAERVTVVQVSQDFFQVLGYRMALGRELRPEDDRAAAAPVAWLTHAAWQRYFHGAVDIVGRSVVLEGQATEIAGVLPAEFRFHRHADVFVPIEPIVDRQFMRERENHNGTAVIGRLKPGVTIERAATQLAAIGQRLEQQYPKANAGIRVAVLPLREQLQGRGTMNLFLLLGAVGTVLLIACVNVANLLLARSFNRRREMAIRTALGASRRDLFSQLLIESLVYALTGGVLGTAIAWFGYAFVARLAPWEMKELLAAGGSFDAWAWLFMAGVTLLTGVGFGFAPAWQLSHSDPNDALKRTPAAVRTAFGRFHLTDGLVVVQVSLAVMLLVGAGLLIQSLYRVAMAPTGLRPDRVITLQVATPPTAAMTRDPHAFIRHHEAMLARLQSVAEIESVAFCSSLPYTWDSSSNWFFRPDRPTPEPGKFPLANVHVVTPDYFRTMGIPLLRGAAFDGRERRAPLVAGQAISMATVAQLYEGFVVDTVISRKMAEQHWPGEDPIGRTFQIGQPQMKLPQMRVIGIVGNTLQFGAERGEQVEYYTLLSQWPATLGLHLVVRTRADAAAALASIRRAVRDVAPDEPIYDVKLMSDRVAEFASNRRFSMGLFAFFAGVAVLLASVGIYGVLACVVGQRTREIGIRMALGASRLNVLGQIVGRGLGLAGLGVGLGLAAAWAASRFLQSQLFGVSTTDLLTYLASALFLLAASILACVVPAQRASRVNPVEALRAE
ncbi:ABC transporter permease [Opitutus sp. ER46]|uniref:ABC transporter permease n=1 Tax=Opitutus sp. ER46 TaxID=2161864 RepID=UPI0011B1E3EA|nr:ABC transporter permease [Opitutus sp. ER46]